MAQDYYSEDMPTMERPMPQRGMMGEEPEGTGEKPTALLPKKFFPGGPELGQVCKVKPVRILDDQVEVEYVKSSKSEESESSEGPPTEQTPYG